MKRMPNINYTLKNDLCTGCGICVGSCPTESISITVNKGNFRPYINPSTCINYKGCHKCLDTCPGAGIDLNKLTHDIFKNEAIECDEYAGKYIAAFTGYSNDYDLRYHSASGGMVTQLLIWLLEKKIIDGAYVTEFEKDSAFKVHSFIATSKEELIKAKGSKYAPVSLDRAIKEIKAAKGSRYVIVGIPCHIQGFRKYEKTDKKFREKIFGYFSIYCSSGRSFFFTEYIFKERRLDIEGTTYLAYRDNGCLGGLVVKGRDIRTDKEFHYYQDYEKYSHPLRSIFVPKRCNLCIDHYGELADISFGDIHLPPYSNDKIGINSLIVRTEKWHRLIHQAHNDNSITLEEIDIDTINKSQPMSHTKKERNRAFIKIHNLLFNKVPYYDELMHNRIKASHLFAYFHTRIQQFIGSHKILWPLIPFIMKRR